MPRVIHFELEANEPERAVQFYSDVFGWKIQKWDGPMDYWLILTGEGEPGIDGGLTRKNWEKPMNTVNTIGVPSVDTFMDKVKQHGGTVVVPKMTIPGVGYLCYCQDTEGNTFGIMESDHNAH